MLRAANLLSKRLRNYGYEFSFHTRVLRNSASPSSLDGGGKNGGEEGAEGLYKMCGCSGAPHMCIMKTALSVWLLMLLAVAEAATEGGDEGADSAPAPGLQPPTVEEEPSVRASGVPVAALRPLREGERAVYLVDLATRLPDAAAAAAVPPLGDVNSLERPGPLSKLFNPASASGLYDDPTDTEAGAEKTRKKRTFCFKCGGGGGGYGGHRGYGGGGYGGGHGGGGFTGGLTISIGGGFRGSKGFHKGGGGGGWGGGGWGGGGHGGGGGCGYGGCGGGGHGGGGYVVQPVIVKQPIYVPSGGHGGGGGGGCGYGGCGGGGGCGYGGCGGGGGHGGSYSYSQSSAQSSAGSYNWGKK